jgi:hypothetical protein
MGGFLLLCSGIGVCRQGIAPMRSGTIFDLILPTAAPGD